MNHFENSRFRFAANNAELLYCPPSVTLADHCYDGADPKPELWWHGTGNVELLARFPPPPVVPFNIPFGGGCYNQPLRRLIQDLCRGGGRTRPEI